MDFKRDLKKTKVKTKKTERPQSGNDRSQCSGFDGGEPPW